MLYFFRKSQCMAGPGLREKRYLGWRTYTSFYEEYKIWSQEEKSSFATFRRVLSVWLERGALAFRKVSQHARFACCYGAIFNVGIAMKVVCEIHG